VQTSTDLASSSFDDLSSDSLIRPSVQDTSSSHSPSFLPIVSPLVNNSNSSTAAQYNNNSLSLLEDPLGSNSSLAILNIIFVVWSILILCLKNFML